MRTWLSWWRYIRLPCDRVQWSKYYTKPELRAVLQCLCGADETESLNKREDIYEKSGIILLFRTSVMWYFNKSDSTCNGHRWRYNVLDRYPDNLGSNPKLSLRFFYSLGPLPCFLSKAVGHELMVIKSPLGINYKGFFSYFLLTVVAVLFYFLFDSCQLCSLIRKLFSILYRSL